MLTCCKEVVIDWMMIVHDGLMHHWILLLLLMHSSMRCHYLVFMRWYRILMHHGRVMHGRILHNRQTIHRLMLHHPPLHNIQHIGQTKSNLISTKLCLSLHLELLCMLCHQSLSFLFFPRFNTGNNGSHSLTNGIMHTIISMFQLHPCFHSLYQIIHTFPNLCTTPLLLLLDACFLFQSCQSLHLLLLHETKTLCFFFLDETKTFTFLFFEEACFFGLLLEQKLTLLTMKRCYLRF
mmetsp:Transcript_10961/g.24202  ORF Transcript_10961/g.24202 Transcript_10961/m.24202 type:complete len:236 (-) Transcript_10961:446-1153(-)